MCIEEFNIEVNTLCEVTLNEFKPARGCEECGHQLKGEELKFDAIYKGHTEHHGALWDTFQLVDPFVCPGCGNITGQIDALCKDLTPTTIEEFFGIA